MRYDRRRLIRWLLIPAFVIGVVWLAFDWLGGRPSATDREVRRLLGVVRQQELRTHPAIQALSRLPKPYPEMTEWALGEDWRTADARRKLTILGVQALPALTNALKNDPSVAVRLVAVQVLGDLQLPQTIGALTNALIQDPSIRVRQSAVGALEKLGQASALPAVLFALRSETDIDMRAATTRCLGVINNPQSVAELIRISQKDHATAERAAAVAALGRIAQPDTLPLLAELLETDTNHEVRARAAEAMTRFQSPDISRWLVAAVTRETNSEGYYVIVDAIRSRNDPQTISALFTLLEQDPDSRVRYRSARALGNLTNSAVVPVLAKAAAEDNDPGVRELAVSSLLSRPNLEDLLGRLNELEVQQWAGFLSETLEQSGSPVTRQEAATALGRLGNRRVVPALLNTLKQDSDEAVRGEACRALGNIAGPEVLPALTMALTNDSSRFVRGIAAKRLALISDPAAAAALLKAAACDKALEVQFTACFASAFALAELGERETASALATVNETNQMGRLAVACAQGLLGDTNCLAVIESNLASRDGRRRYAAVLALMRLKSPKASELLNSCRKDRAPGIRLLATGALEGRGALALAEMLRDSDPELRHAAARALVLSDEPAVLPALHEAFRDKDAEVCSAAIAAVKRIEGMMNKPL